LVTDHPRLLLPALLLALVACQAAPTASTSGASLPEPTASPSPAQSQAGSTASPVPTPFVTLAPGRPYDGADVLEAMRSSRRPGGVPDELEREPIVSAVAHELWTIDGRPWSEMVAGGSCGPHLCTLEIGGTRDAAQGEDLYIFEVDPGAGRVTVQSSDLRGMEPALVSRLDLFARAHWPEAPLPGPLASARWLPPPRASVFVLSYRSGGEEGSPAVDAVVDVTLTTVELQPPGG
jgi:hypothetical protein